MPKDKKHRRKKLGNLVGDHVTKKERKQWKENNMVQTKRPEYNIGDEVQVSVRGRIVEMGSELLTINLVELRQQNRTNQDIVIYSTYEAVESSAIQERMPNEIPN